jgi:hypothetical protein
MPIFSVADPDPGSRVKKIPDRGSGSGMNIPDHISKSLKTNFLGRDPEFFFTLDPVSEWTNFGSGIWDKHPGSATLRILFVFLHCFVSKIIDSRSSTDTYPD